ncbi:hypothetical protein EV127DRAFT_482205 [Xylaria flabelliformis]|nr:hypothetical protein EV127DRAFT_482205 [Xylaria flabelliformis]
MTLINRQSEGIAYAESPGQSLSGKSFNETFIQCLDLYKTLTICVLEKSNLDIGEEADIDFNHLLDEFGRLRIWGEQTKASLAPNARGSLDDFLRNEKRLRQEVQEVLGQLEIQLSLAVSVAKEACQQHPTPDDDVSDRMTSDSDYSSENGSKDNIHYRSARPKVSKLSIIVSHMFEHVQLLYHFGSLLRRPGLKGRYLRHNNSDNKNTATIFDFRHIEEKLRQWYQEAGEGLNVSPEEDKAMSLNVTSTMSCLGGSRKPMLRDEEQLKYWVNNPCQLDRSQEPKINKVMGKSPIGKAAIQQKSKEDDAGTGDGTSTIQPESKGPRSEKSRSTLISFSTVDESAFLETGTETGKPRTIYAESVVAGKWSTRVPPPPNRATIIDGVRQYKCPYCYMDLDEWLM